MVLADRPTLAEVPLADLSLMFELRRQQDPRVVGDGGIFDRYVSPAKRKPKRQ